MKVKFLSLLFFLICPGILLAQEVTIKGRVTDGETGDGVPFAPVYIIGTPFGTECDMDGYYTFKAKVKAKDTISVSYLGYKTKKRAISPTPAVQEFNFTMRVDEKTMMEVVIKPQENPAFAIMRKVIKNKDINDPRKLTAYRYDNYSKMEISIDNLGPRMQRKKFMKAIMKELAKDSLTLEKGNDGNPVMPVIFSETVSKVYHNRSGNKTKEEIIAVKNTNLGLSNGQIVKPLLYSTYQGTNFYENRVRILLADFLSPIADSWELIYDYELTDTVFVDGDSCYQINVKPKNPADLAFTGTIWISDSAYALKQMDVRTNKQTNLNFVEGIRIYQLQQQTASYCWMPVKTRIELDLSNITHWKLGVLARLTTYSTNMFTNDPMPAKFFDETITEAEDAYDREREMDKLRKDTLTTYERNFSNSIHTISQVPPVKRYVILANILSNGYLRLGKIELGHYLSLYNNNNVEGIRTSIGFRTNHLFSRKVIFRGYGAYGFDDNIFKYSAAVDFILDRRPWTIMGFERRYDMDQVGVNPELMGGNEVFYAFTKNGTMKGPYYNTSNNIYFQTDLRKGLTQKVTLRHRDFNPVYAFEYYVDPGNTDSVTSRKYTTSEVILETRWGKDEFRFINGNQRLSNGARKWPIFTLKNTFGVKDVLNSQFQYYKLALFIKHSFTVGILGRTYYDVYAGKIFGTVPYPLLETHIGNESYFYSTIAFNQMDYFEFISDTYATLRLRHYFGGLFFNRMPLIKKFKWSFFVTSNVAFGSLSDRNYNLIPSTDAAGNNLRNFYTLNDKPYVEVGYGIENIFKFLRVDFVHRLSYLDHPGVRRFGVKFSFQVNL